MSTSHATKMEVMEKEARTCSDSGFKDQNEKHFCPAVAIRPKCKYQRCEKQTHHWVSYCLYALTELLAGRSSSKQNPFKGEDLSHIKIWCTRKEQLPYHGIVGTIRPEIALCPDHIKRAVEQTIYKNDSGNESAVFVQIESAAFQCAKEALTHWVGNALETIRQHPSWRVEFDNEDDIIKTSYSDFDAYVTVKEARPEDSDTPKETSQVYLEKGYYSGDEADSEREPIYIPVDASHSSDQM